MKRLAVFVVLGLWCFTPNCMAYWNDFEQISITNFNLTDDNPVQFTLALTRIDRRNFGISGEVIVKDYANLMMDVKIYHQATPNAKFNRLMYGIDRTSGCDYLNSYYLRLLQKDLREPISDLPQFDGPGPELCTAFANRTWHIRHMVFDSSKIPKFFQPGNYKIVFSVYEGDSDVVVSGSQYIFRLF